MVFTLISSAQEWLGSKVDELKKKRLEEIERNAKEKEEAERVGANVSHTLKFANSLLIKF